MVGLPVRDESEQMRTTTAVRRIVPPALATTVAAVLVAVATAAVAWARIGAPARGVAWAEDSGRFLNDRLQLGPVRALLNPYDGYLHLLPRTVVDAAVALAPIDRYAETVSLLCCTVLGLVCATVFVLARDVVRPWPLRLLLAVVPTVVPLAPVEILGTAANLHWYLLFAMPWLLLHRSRTWWSAAALAVAVLLVTLSEIQSAVFLPLLLVRTRDRRQVPVAAAAVLGIAAQVTTALTHPRTHQLGATSFWDMTAGWFAQAVAGSWDADLSAVGSAVSADSWWVVVVPGVLLLGCVAVAVVLARGQLRWVLLATAAGSLAVWYAALVANRTPDTDWTAFSATDWAATVPFRYAAASSMFLIAAVVLAAAVFIGRATWTARGVGAALAAATVVVAVLGVGTVPTRASGPSWAGQVEQRAGFCAAHPWASVKIGAMPRVAGWNATVTCEMVDHAVGH